MPLSAGIAESRLYLHSGITLAGALCLYDAGNSQSYPGTGVTWFNLISGTTVGHARKQGSQVAQGWPKWDSRGWFNFNGGNIGDNFGRFDFTFPQLNDVSFFAWYRLRVEPLLTNEEPGLGSGNQMCTAQHIMRSQNSTDANSSYQFYADPGRGAGGMSICCPPYTTAPGIGVTIANNYFPGTGIGSVNAFNGEWHQIVGTRNASNNEQRAYFDGVLGGSLIAAGQQPKAGTMRIGARNDAYSAHFYGSIAMCGMYERVLTPTEVYNNYLTMVKRLNRPDYNIGFFPEGDKTRYYER